MKGKQLGLSKNERLNSKREIKELFSKGSSFFLYPYKVRYIASIEPTFPKILITVPKRNFKSAVVRNRIRRQIKEAYRLTKGEYHEGLPIKSIAFIFVGKEAKNDFYFLKERMGKLLVEIKRTP